MRVIIPPALHSYTNGAREVEGSGTTVAVLFDELDRRYPGIRFRMIDEQDGIRPHIKVFVNQMQATAIDASLTSTDKVLIVCALSGG